MQDRRVITGFADKWLCEPGEWIVWTASEANRCAIKAADPCRTATSFVQQDHLRSARPAGRSINRLGVTRFTVFEHFDEAVMERVITDFLRAHSTFHTWFSEAEDGTWEGRTLPADQIEVEVAARSESLPGVTVKDFVLERLHTLDDWSAFAFGVSDLECAQGDDPRFTLIVCSDHLYTDGVSQAITFVELLSRYTAAVAGVQFVEIPTRPYGDYAAAQRARIAALAPDSPEVLHWREVVSCSGGTLPSFPLPLGLADGAAAPGAMAVGLEFVGAQELDQFRRVVRAAGGTMNAGLLAVMAELNRRFTGQETFTMTVPRNDRSDPLDALAVGWYVTLVPVHFECPASATFADIVRNASAGIAAARQLDGVPIYPLIDLLADDPAFGVDHGFAAPMLSYLDLTRLPGADLAVRHDFSVFGNATPAREVFLWLNRHEGGLDFNAMHPATPTATVSVHRYLDEFREVILRMVATGGLAAMASLSAA